MKRCCWKNRNIYIIPGSEIVHCRVCGRMKVTLRSKIRSWLKAVL